MKRQRQRPDAPAVEGPHGDEILREGTEPPQRLLRVRRVSRLDGGRVVAVVGPVGEEAGEGGGGGDGAGRGPMTLT